jgi:hypothetical protein
MNGVVLAIRDRELASITLAEANYEGARRLLLQQEIGVLLVDEAVYDPFDPEGEETLMADLVQDLAEPAPKHVAVLKRNAG